MSRTKINWLLILQAWAMLWVVIGHSSLGEVGAGPAWENMLVTFAYSFHMPLFMAISGWLFYFTRLSKPAESGGSGWTYKAIIGEKAVRLLIPMVVFTFVAFCVKIAFSSEVTRQTALSVKEVVNAFIYPYDSPLREMWFIATLFWMFLLTPLWRIVIKNTFAKLSFLVALVLLYFFHPNVELLCIGKVCSYAVFFYLGIIISQSHTIERIVSQRVWLFLLLGIVIYVAGEFIDSLVVTFGGMLFSCALALVLDRYIPKCFISFRDYTYQIFLMGIFAQFFIKILYRHLHTPYIPSFVLCILFGLYIPVLVSILIKKINWPPLLYCIGLKPQKRPNT